MSLEGFVESVSKMYENFLMRDLAYVLGGTVFLGSVIYAYNVNCLIRVSLYITHDFFKFILFLIISYSVGLILQEGFYLFHLVKIRPREEDKKYSEFANPYDEFMLVKKIKEYSPCVITEIERIIYFKHFSATFMASSLSSFFAIILLRMHFRFIFCFSSYKCPHIPIILFFLLILSIICFWENCYKYEQQFDTLKKFKNFFNTEKQT